MKTQRTLKENGACCFRKNGYYYFNGDYLNREDRTGDGCVLLEKYKPNLMTIHLIATDHFQHEQGRNGKSLNRNCSNRSRYW
jgi:hypothetical protein